MKNLNFNLNIDLTDKQKKAAIGIAAFASIFLLGWAFVIQPAIGQIQILKRTRQDIQARFKIISELSKMNEEKQQFARTLGDVQNRHLILAKVTELAQEAKVDINTITPSLEQGQQFPELIFELKGTASFGFLMKFLSGLEQTTPAIFVRKLDIDIGDYYRGKRLRSEPSISMVLVTYLKPSNISSITNSQPSQTMGFET